MDEFPKQPVGSTSSSLLERVKQADNEAWNQLASLYVPLVYHWCRQASLQPDDSCEIVQNVFWVVATSVAHFRNEKASDSFRGWLKGSTRNKIRDHFRQIGREPQAFGGLSGDARFLQLTTDFPSLNEGSDQEILFSRLDEALQQVREQVGDHIWQAFWKTTVEKQPGVEVAQELNMTPEAVYQAKSRLLRKLRELLSGSEGS